MYGMLLESIQYFVQKDYGQTKWQQVLEHAGIKNMVFTTHAVYSDETMQNLATSCACVLKDKTKEGFFQYFGQCFVLFFSNYGYDKIMRVAGRNYRDFLHEIDNLHEMMRYSYSKMRSPSFLVVSEDSNGCILRYRSKRKGFQNYVIGQLTQCAYRFYQINVSISVLTEETLSKGCDITFRLDFDNSAHMQCKYSIANGLSYDMFGIISSDIFFKVFPFCIVFDQDLTILRTGHNMSSWLDTKDLIGSHIDARFTLKRPLLEFTWNNIMSHQGVTFELQYTSRTRHRASITVTVLQNGVKHAAEGIPSTTSSHRLIFRGQMKYINSWKAVAFLCKPLVGSLEDMRQVGLYLNDLNLFDNSRHMVIDGWHHASQLEDLVEQQKDHSHQISENMKKLDDWKNKSDALLYSMIPESIACRLKQGEDPINTCETFDQVTILFSYIVGFADICTMASPMDIVRCINSIFSTFDAVIDKYNVFKVETLGDAVYMVAGGVPDRKSDHAVSIAGLALELVETAVMLKDPVSGGHLQLRAGMHTGGVVAGIIGKRMPQYCLFGDTVNTASRMQSYSEPGRIHLSEPCHDCVKGFCDSLPWIRERQELKDDRPRIIIFKSTNTIGRPRGLTKGVGKGKGEMNTYWLVGKKGDTKAERLCEKLHNERRKVFHRHLNTLENGFDLHGMHSVSSEAQLSSLIEGSEDGVEHTGGDDKTNQTDYHHSTFFNKQFKKNSQYAKFQVLPTSNE